MALSAEGISRGRNGASEVDSLSKDLNNSSENLKGILNSNGNYQYFKMGTDKGASVDNDLNTTLDTVVNDLVPQIQSLLAAIEAFFVRQEEENRRAMQEKMKSNATTSSTAGVEAFTGNINIA